MNEWMSIAPFGTPPFFGSDRLWRFFLGKEGYSVRSKHIFSYVLSSGIYQWWRWKEGGGKSKQKRHEQKVEKFNLKEYKRKRKICVLIKQDICWCFFKEKMSVSTMLLWFLFSSENDMIYVLKLHLFTIITNRSCP